MNGALVFTGTRVPVEILIQHLTAGDSLETFLSDFPSVNREQASAFLELALRGAETAAAAALRISAEAHKAAPPPKKTAA